MTNPLVFSDHPEFTPNVHPRDMFQHGIFQDVGGYWRPIYSSIVKANFVDQWKEFDFLADLSEELMVGPVNKNANKYRTIAGTSLEYWESKNWITHHDPYGWVQWYCRFVAGRRLPKEDERQIARWQQLAGPNGRFYRRLKNIIASEKDSPRIRQTLLQWAILV